MNIDELENIIKSDDANSSILYANKYELQTTLDALEDLSYEIKKQLRSIERMN